METIRNRTDYTKAMMEDGTCILEGVTKTCPNCKVIAPFVEKMMKKYPDARFYSYDVDEAEDVAQELGVRLVPSFHVFADGMVSDSVTGAKSKPLEDAIKQNYDGRVVEDA